MQNLIYEWAYKAEPQQVLSVSVSQTRQVWMKDYKYVWNCFTPSLPVLGGKY